MQDPRFLSNGVGHKAKGPGPHIPEPEDPGTEVNTCRDRIWMANELLRLALLDIASKTADHALEHIERTALREFVVKLETMISGSCGVQADQVWAPSNLKCLDPLSSTVNLRVESSRYEQSGGCVGLNPITDMIRSSDEIDVDGNRPEVSGSFRNSAMSFMNKRSSHTLRQKHFAKMFEQLDVDRSGYVGIEELRASLSGLGFREKDIACIMNATDGNGDGDGLISRAEWMRFVEKQNESSAIEALKSRLDCLNNLPQDRFRRPRFMVSQKSIYRIFWDLVNVFFLIYIAVSLPFQLAFVNDNARNHISKIIDWCIDICFVIDIVLNVRTTFITDDGFEVWDWYRVAINYGRRWFLIDVVSTLPIDRITASEVSAQSSKSVKMGKLVRVFRFLKFARFGRVFQSVSRSEFGQQVGEALTSSMFQSKFSLLLLLMLMLFLSHLLACLMALAGDVCYKGLEPDTTARRYLVSMYWATTTVTTVGYGDISPITDEERLVAMLGMVVGGGFYGYVIGSISDMVTARGLKVRAYYERMEEVIAWCEHHRFPLEQRKMVRCFFQRFLSTEAAPVDEAAIINDLTPDLRREISKFMIRDEVRNCYLFAQVPPGVLARIAQIIKNMKVSPDELIVECGGMGTAMFIIESGSVYLLGEGTDGMPDDSKFEALDFGDSFGEEIILGFTDIYHYDAKAESSTSMHVIDEERFVSTMLSVPDSVALMRENAKHLLDVTEETKEPIKTKKRSYKRTSAVSKTSSLPSGFAESVYDLLDQINHSLDKLQAAHGLTRRLSK